MKPHNLNGGRPSILTDVQRAYIKNNLDIPLRTIAKQFGVHYSTIYYALKPKQKKHV